MKLNEANIKSFLYLFIVGLLWLPIFQTKFKIIDFLPLNGAVDNVEDAYISKSAWMAGEYQEKQELYLKHNFGFRAPVVRLYNQWHYSFYNVASANGVLIGKENYLYEENYIKAYLGLDFLGNDSIAKQINKLKLISDSLKQKNVDLVVLLAPGKASFYPDYLPSKYNNVKKGITNYEIFKEQLDKNQIHTIDFNKWFIDNKSTIHKKHKLYSKTGIHWSNYGEYLVQDSLLKYYTNLTKNKFPSIKLEKVVQDDSLRYSDNDVCKGMNLLVDLPDFKMSYPIFQYENMQYNNTKVLTIADSYYWGIFGNGFSRDCLADGEFWYYFQERFPLHFYEKALVSESDMKKELESNRIVTIICTDANLFKFGFGFIDEVYNLYK